MDVKKCPFQVDANGDFKDCLGEACMAYCERETPVYRPDSDEESSLKRYVRQSEKITSCLRMVPEPVSYCV